MPWSIRTDGGGPGAMLTWAEDLLNRIGAPVTAGNKRFIYDWEVSEGGGGKYNPLNQGPVPWDPALTTTGQQYGGGAADYASWDAGLQGAADYLSMSNYQAIETDLLNNNPDQAKKDLWASPWASSHYGYGAAWSTAALPGQAAPLGGSGGGGSGGGGGFDWNPLSWPGQLASDVTRPIGAAISDTTSTLQRMAIVIPVVLAAGALAVVGFIRMTGRHPVQEAGQHLGQAAQAAGTAAVMA